MLEDVRPVPRSFLVIERAPPAATVLVFPTNKIGRSCKSANLTIIGPQELRDPSSTGEELPAAGHPGSMPRSVMCPEALWAHTCPRRRDPI